MGRVAAAQARCRHTRSPPAPSERMRHPTHTYKRMNPQRFLDEKARITCPRTLAGIGRMLIRDNICGYIGFGRKERPERSADARIGMGVRMVHSVHCGDLAATGGPMIYRCTTNSFVWSGGSPQTNKDGLLAGPNYSG